MTDKAPVYVVLQCDPENGWDKMIGVFLSQETAEAFIATQPDHDDDWFPYVVVSTTLYS